jgi:hypothetical protein
LDSLFDIANDSHALLRAADRLCNREAVERILAKTAKLPGGKAAMTARCLTALVGGYAAAAGIAPRAARILPVDRLEATIWSMLLSFALYAALGLWAFHEPRLTRVAAIIWGGAILSGGAALLLGMRP